MTTLHTSAAVAQARRSAEFVQITPELAREYLRHNRSNRPIRTTYVEQLAGAMRRGEWQTNGDAVRFDVDGNLLDAQHRLIACAASGVTIEMLVIRGLPREVMSTIDVGAKRSYADHLKFLGVKSTNFTDLAAALRFLFGVETNNFSGNIQATSEQKNALLERHPRIVNFVEPAQRLYRATKLGRTAGIVGLYKIDEAAGTEAAAAWLEQLYSGEDLHAGDPRLALRQYLLIDRTDDFIRIRKFQYLALIKAWNASVTGRSMRKIVFGASEELVREPLAPDIEDAA